ncbi:MAG: hypothetical protein ACYCYM_09250 [Saccharofermentanales bacterium]
MKIFLKNIAEKSRKYRMAAIAAGFCMIAVLEVLSYAGFAAASVIASRIWLSGACFTLIVILYGFSDICIKDIRSRNFLPPAGILALIGALLFFVGNIGFGEINPDAAQQLTAGLGSFGRNDLDYTAKAFLGYPARQYVLGALPAFLGGRSIYTLHLGFALPFIAGVMSLYTGLRRKAGASESGPAAALLAVYSVFLFPYIAEYYLNFEQAIYPVALTMIAAGLLLGFLTDGSIASVLALTWTGCLMSNSYTPALASLALLIAILVLVLLSSRPNRNPPLLPEAGGRAAAALAAMSGLLMIVFFIATLIGSRGDRLLQVHESSGVLQTAAVNIYESLTDRNAVFLGMTGIPVMIYLVAGLSFSLKPRDFIISLWVLGTFAAAFMLRGYTVYRSEWILQRAMIVIPVLVAGIAITGFDRLRISGTRMRTGTVALFLAVLCVAGFSNFSRINQSFTYFNHIQPMKYIISDLGNIAGEKGIASDDKFYLILYTDNTLMKNTGDYMKFFYPNAISIVPQGKEFPQDLLLEYPVFIYSIKALPDVPQIGYTEDIVYNNIKRREEIHLYRCIIG